MAVTNDLLFGGVVSWPVYQLRPCGVHFLTQAGMPTGRVERFAIFHSCFYYWLAIAVICIAIRDAKLNKMFHECSLGAAQISITVYSPSTHLYSWVNWGVQLRRHGEDENTQVSKTVAQGIRNQASRSRVRHSTAELSSPSKTLIINLQIFPILNQLGNHCDLRWPIHPPPPLRRGRRLDLVPLSKDIRQSGVNNIVYVSLAIDWVLNSQPFSLESNQHFIH